MIFDSLKKNNRIVTLNLAGNEISGTILKDIENCLISNSKLAGPSTTSQNTAIHNPGETVRQLPFGQQASVLEHATRTIQTSRIEGLASAEAVLNEERRRGLESKDFMSRQLDDLRRKDLRGA